MYRNYSLSELDLKEKGGELQLEDNRIRRTRQHRSNV